MSLEEKTDNSQKSAKMTIIYPNPEMLDDFEYMRAKMNPSENYCLTGEISRKISF
ncbi:MAG: hypothetical protein AABX93_03140 [Nanoarchaeota archaeon]